MPRSPDCGAMACASTASVETSRRKRSGSSWRVGSGRVGSGRVGSGRVGQDYDAIDVLVNNAGVSLICPAEDTTAAQWQRVMSINLLGPFLLSRYLGALMLLRRNGSIVNVASTRASPASVIAAPTTPPRTVSSA
jgi:NAD(P)-dependent dehydrogenase (short-subunit alcohol dehydrogenase family)